MTYEGPQNLAFPAKLLQYILDYHSSSRELLVWGVG